jgi:hypothetical protein
VGPGPILSIGVGGSRAHSQHCYLARPRFNLELTLFQDGVLLSIDWLGLITEWRVGPGPILKNVTRPDGAFLVPRLLERRDVERLIDFNSEYLGRYSSVHFFNSVVVLNTSTTSCTL